MEMTLKIIEKEISLTEDIPVIVVTYTDVISYANGYHVYKNVCAPHLQEQVHGEIKPDNPLDNKYAVAVKKDGKIVEQLSLRKNGKCLKRSNLLL